MFLDEATIEAVGGLGGRGCVSWRREKYVPRGGPDGGDGGDGGDVILLADENTDTLSDFASRKKFEAPKGRFGSGQNRGGREGEDLVLPVPPGTVVKTQKTHSKVAPDQEKWVIVGDLRTGGDRMLIAHGGRGGYGNAHFKSALNQAPDFAELGEPGERVHVLLELKLVADVGIIGYPNVGKSTLISVISAARPKIADYPFTTIVPNLGVAKVDDRSFVVCDIPGLIEGASEGKGLGGTFLRHIERCGILVHVLDISRALKEGRVVDADALAADYRAIRNELATYSPLLAQKRELVILNKADVISGETEQIERELKDRGIEVFLTVSAAQTLRTEELKKKLLPLVLKERTKLRPFEEEEPAEAAGEIPILRPHLTSDKMGAYRLEKRTDGSIVVTGKRVEQFTNMTDFGNGGGRQRFLNVLDRIGLTKAIAKMRGPDAHPVYIGETRIDTFL